MIQILKEKKCKRGLCFSFINENMIQTVINIRDSLLSCKYDTGESLHR